MSPLTCTRNVWVIEVDVDDVPLDTYRRGRLSKASGEERTKEALSQLSMRRQDRHGYALAGPSAHRLNKHHSMEIIYYSPTLRDDAKGDIGGEAIEKRGPEVRLQHSRLRHGGGWVYRSSRGGLERERGRECQAAAISPYSNGPFPLTWLAKLPRSNLRHSCRTVHIEMKPLWRLVGRCSPSLPLPLLPLPATAMKPQFLGRRFANLIPRHRPSATRVLRSFHTLYKRGDPNGASRRPEHLERDRDTHRRKKRFLYSMLRDLVQR